MSDQIEVSRDEVLKATWPHRQLDALQWNRDADKFVQLLCSNPAVSMANADLKFVTVYIDTRTGDFIVSDRKGVMIKPDVVQQALVETEPRRPAALQDRQRRRQGEAS